MVHPSVSATTVADFVRHARANPGKLSYGSAGGGTLPHVAAEMLLRIVGVQAVHVPFKGSGPALGALLGGQIDFVFDPGVAIPHVKAGKVRLIAVGGASRSQGFPDIPTLREAGIDMTAISIVGLYTTTGTRPDIVARLNQELSRLMQTGEFRSALAAMAAEPIEASPDAFAALLARDRERYGTLVREANIQVD